jgi:hypothetical protein
MSGLQGAGHSFKGTESYQGGTRYFVLTAAMGTAPQPIKLGTGGRLCKITNTGLAAQAVNIACYDSNTITTPGTNGTLLCTIVPGATASQTNPTVIDIPFDAGLVIVASGAVTGTVLIQYV